MYEEDKHVRGVIRTIWSLARLSSSVPPLTCFLPCLNKARHARRFFSPRDAIYNVMFSTFSSPPKSFPHTSRTLCGNIHDGLRFRVCGGGTAPLPGKERERTSPSRLCARTERRCARTRRRSWMWPRERTRDAKVKRGMEIPIEMERKFVARNTQKRNHFFP